MWQRILNVFRRGPVMPVYDRSSRWPAVRAAHLRRQPRCMVCNRLDDLDVHHKFPISHPGGEKMELDAMNLITLCREHHFLFGHGQDWNARNPYVEQDCELMRRRIRQRLYA